MAGTLILVIYTAEIVIRATIPCWIVSKLLKLQKFLEQHWTITLPELETLPAPTKWKSYFPKI